MKTAESFWVFGVLAMLIVSLQLFRYVRQRTEGYREAVVFKENLPNWVSMFEAISLIISLLLVAGVMLAGFGKLYNSIHPGHAIQGGAAALSVLGVMSIALPFAGLAANLISWALPPVRAANLRAMSGSKVSFGQMNRGLFLFSAVSSPLGIALMGLAIVQPWSK